MQKRLCAGVGSVGIRCQWLPAFPHLPCAGIKPSRGPPLCLTLKRTRTKVEHVSVLQKHTIRAHTDTQ